MHASGLERPGTVTAMVAAAARRDERKRCAKICEDMRESKRPFVMPLTNAAYDEACRDCAAAILGRK